MKKKDRNQRRPGRRRSQEDGGGACELPLRAGPAANSTMFSLSSTVAAAALPHSRAAAAQSLWTGVARRAHRLVGPPAIDGHAC